MWFGKIAEQFLRIETISIKEELLIEIAARKFESPQNFVLFEQDELVGQITQKLRLANAQEGLAVLKAIESQHGLLIERADELWSFSHLTFQEHFTVQWLTQLPPQQLAEKIGSHQWQEVVRQLVKSQQPADRLLQLIKQAIDQQITQEAVIQAFLDWLVKKSSSLQSNYKPAAIRVFYYLLTPDHNPSINLEFGLDANLHAAIGTAFGKATERARETNFNIDIDIVLGCEIESELAIDSDLESIFANTLSIDSTLANVLNINSKLKRAIDRAINLKHPSDLGSRLSQLQKELPTSTDSNGVQHWCSLHATEWNEQLRQVMMEYRNVGYDWRFTREEKKQLHHYQEINKFLVELMDIKGAVSKECRTEIEEGLLLPWAELQRRQPYLYGELKA